MVTSDVKDTIWKAWKAYVQKAFAKSLANVAEDWPLFQDMVAKNDPAVIRGEKFDMQFNLAVSILNLLLKKAISFSNLRLSLASSARSLVATRQIY